MSDPYLFLPVFYHRFDWKWLYQPPPSQFLSSFIQNFWRTQWHSRETWSHHMRGMTTTQVNHISPEDNLRVQICSVRYIFNKTDKTQTKLITFIFIIPGSTTFTSFAQVLSSMYADLFGITLDLFYNLYLVTKLITLRLWFTFVSEDILGWRAWDYN